MRRRRRTRPRDVARCSSTGSRSVERSGRDRLDRGRSGLAGNGRLHGRRLSGGASVGRWWGPQCRHQPDPPSAERTVDSPCSPRDLVRCRSRGRSCAHCDTPVENFVGGPAEGASLVTQTGQARRVISMTPLPNSRRTKPQSNRPDEAVPVSGSTPVGGEVEVVGATVVVVARGATSLAVAVMLAD